MSLPRRSFLRFMGVAPLAAGALAKQTAVSIAGANAEMFSGIAVAGNAANTMSMPCPSSPSKAFGLLKMFGLPSWKKKEIASYARMSRVLDPDLASLRSVSLSAKLRMQYARNETRMERDLWLSYDSSSERESWLKKHELDWL